jgi:hypothetical protein
VTDDSTKTVKVIALDPGRTTGYAVGTINDGKLGVVSGQAVWDEYQLYSQLKFANPDIIIYESFQYRNKLDRADLYPCYLIGVINLYGAERATQVRELLDHRPVVLYEQTPAQGKSYFADKQLKDSNVYKVGNPHANDAMRHILHWWTFGAGYRYNTGGYESLA